MLIRSERIIYLDSFIFFYKDCIDNQLLTSEPYKMMKQREDLDHSYIGGHFDRQVRIHDWDQKMLEKQHVAILGVGGLGSIVLMALLRLGVKKIHLVDYDVVDNHNMNRQLMFSVKDIGQRKVDCAIKNAEFHNVGGTQLEGFHGNALTNWKKIIQFVKESDIVFNCIDHGDKFDLAITSLCLKLKKPLVMGGTFATSMTIDYFSPQGIPCFLCTNDEMVRQTQTIQKIHPDKILDYQDISFLPKNNNPIGRSSTIVCTICGQFMVSQYLNHLFLSEQKPMKPVRVIAYHNTTEIISFTLQANKKCPFCGDPNYVQPQKTPQNTQINWNQY